MRLIAAALAVLLACTISPDSSFSAKRKVTEKHLAQKHPQALIAQTEEGGEG